MEVLALLQAAQLDTAPCRVLTTHAMPVASPGIAGRSVDLGSPRERRSSGVGKLSSLRNARILLGLRPSTRTTSCVVVGRNATPLWTPRHFCATRPQLIPLHPTPWRISPPPVRINARSRFAVASGACRSPVIGPPAEPKLWLLHLWDVVYAVSAPSCAPGLVSSEDALRGTRHSTLQPLTSNISTASTASSAQHPAHPHVASESSHQRRVGARVRPSRVGGCTPASVCSKANDTPAGDGCAFNICRCLLAVELWLGDLRRRGGGNASGRYRC
ncbi:hypothetical protein K466DRAFT_214951 [Polyporus arcularius HHB13444]|uniref:Uncharacterized protein n=1 Tax=Polyporus arcularius HHB13444 TaxID=1314778 RepID=A0A5C3P674_9APHY|nr:hypothetical protein K466DRAFT_214951 [Polyporus arcularius HHB13444]